MYHCTPTLLGEIQSQNATKEALPPMAQTNIELAI